LVIRNPLVPYLIRHGLAGALAGWLTVAALLACDVGGIGTLAFASDLFPVPLIMLFWFFGLTFASVAMGAAIMGLGRSKSTTPTATRSVNQELREGHW
jgi:hypothetical protein